MSEATAPDFARRITSMSALQSCERYSPSIPPFGSGLSPRGCGPDADSGQRRSSACRRRPERDALAVGRSDLVVSDVGMPGEDGYRLIASLRARRTRPGAAEPRVLRNIT